MTSLAGPPSFIYSAGAFTHLNTSSGQYGEGNGQKVIQISIFHWSEEQLLMHLQILKNMNLIEFDKESKRVVVTEFGADAPGISYIQA